MDDAACQKFFTAPMQIDQRRYEAVRAVFVEGRSQKEVAQQLGYTYGSMRQLVLEFRRHLRDSNKSPASFFFATPKARETPASPPSRRR